MVKRVSLLVILSVFFLCFLTNAVVVAQNEEGEVIKKKAPPTTNPLCLSNEKQSAMSMVAICIFLFISLLFVYAVLRFHIHWFPESIGVVFIGAAIGLILRFVLPSQVHVISQLDPSLFFVIFLPAIIFDASYTLNKGDFFGNIGSIILYAFVGTAISTICVAAGIYATGYFGLSIELPWVEAFMYGSLISAVDPVATLAIFNALKVNPTLHYLVFGESIVNDAVAVVLFETFERFANAGTTSTSYLVVQGTIQFIVNSVGSVAVGIIFALLGALFFRIFDMRKFVTLEISIFFIFAYLPYVLSFPFLSGIMTVMTSGIVMSYYLTPNLSKEGSQAISAISHALAFVCETFVFVYMGMAVFAFTDLKWDWALTGFVILFCLIGRFFNIVPITGVVNLYRNNKITARNQFIMWFSGLRGAIAFALAVGWRRHSEIAEYFFTTTIMVVLFTIVVFGGLTYPFLKLFKVETQADMQMSKTEQTKQVVDAEKYWTDVVASRQEHTNLITKFDEKVMRRIFVRPDALPNQDLTSLAKVNQEWEEDKKELEMDELHDNAAFESNNHLPILNMLKMHPDRAPLIAKALEEYNKGNSSSVSIPMTPTALFSSH